MWLDKYILQIIVATFQHKMHKNCVLQIKIKNYFMFYLVQIEKYACFRCTAATDAWQELYFTCIETPQLSYSAGFNSDFSS